MFQSKRSTTKFRGALLQITPAMLVASLSTVLFVGCAEPSTGNDRSAGWSCYFNTGPVATFNGSDHDFASVCVDFAGATTAASARELCDSSSYDVDYSVSLACPTENLVGTCSYTHDQSQTGEAIEVRFYSPDWTAEDGQSYCNTVSPDGGVWTSN